ncbi:hypothetical protein EJ06DRAFT_524701 [Trichodelitschia bisporula]|uniref:IgE-binding protein n=1 Tax=Trichodelitschia bisporula TaxID=703511 RepID=A0A6G1HK80_9PEZI|nr:hypothetical protein EJ06DRAFT_524701 [Trichodelitschia bisporula]
MRPSTFLPALIPLVSALPTARSDVPQAPYTLTAYALDKPVFNGLRVNNLHLFQARVNGTCPLTSPDTPCPNGTQMAFGGVVQPITLVPGGQALYVAQDGRLTITAPHSHVLPAGALPPSVGWTWTALSADNATATVCGDASSADMTFYDCSAPTGVWKFADPSAGDASGSSGGVVSCKDDDGAWALWAVRAGNASGAECVALDGLATHTYDGPVPPVWGY